MFRLMSSFSADTQRQRDFWLAGQFGVARNHHNDKLIEAWSDLLGRDQAKLWLQARQYGAKIND